MDSDRQTLIIGDIHGQLFRLEELLFQEGLLDHCPVCAGEGDDTAPTGEPTFCGTCHGFGVMRINRDVEVVQLGDLVDLMPMRTSESADGTVMHAGSYWIDVFLCGNHEAPMQGMRAFGGYVPNLNVQHIIATLKAEGRYRLAHAAHGYLITHAGLGNVMAEQRTGSLKRHDVERLGAWINRKNKDKDSIKHGPIHGGWPVRDNISMFRGGWHEDGGIIWRDSREALWDVPQIFGHTSHELALQVSFPEKGLPSYCIDTSKHGSVSAIWLPEQKIVTVKDSAPAFAEHG